MMLIQELRVRRKSCSLAQENSGLRLMPTGPGGQKALPEKSFLGPVLPFALPFLTPHAGEKPGCQCHQTQVRADVPIIMHKLCRILVDILG
jgi:hypothetical protein